MLFKKDWPGVIEMKHFNADAVLDIFSLRDNDSREHNAFEEYAAHIFSEGLKKFISEMHTGDDYKNLVNDIFRKVLECAPDDPVWKLLNYLENESDFYTAPASTRFHSNKENGLVCHSLLVAAHGVNLASVMLSGDVDMYFLFICCLLHDFCKVNMYEISMRNAKNEETGVWEKVPFYKVRDDYISYGHGVESMLRLNKYISMPEAWNHAIRWHMGAYDITPLDKIALGKSLSVYKEVLFLQTADMQAGLVDEI
jgi:hypothetical protein